MNTVIQEQPNASVEDGGVVCKTLLRGSSLDEESSTTSESSSSLDNDSSDNTAGANTNADSELFVDASEFEQQSIVYRPEELEAMRNVRRILLEEHNAEISPRVLALTTIINKLRVDDAVKAYLKFQEAVALVGIDSLDDIEEITPQVREYLGKSYEACGVDHLGRRILWIRGRHTTAPSEEEAWIRASVIYWIATHADSISLRQGIQLVIDVSARPDGDPYGNSSKLQKINQAFPMRPQTILIAGSNFAKRVVINGLIKVASLFVKAKVLARIKFVSTQQAADSLPKESAPQYLGGGGGGIDNVVDWVQERMNGFPIPQL